jgi:hypothetical protein
MTLKTNMIHHKVRIYPSKNMELIFERTETFQRKFVTRNSLYLYSLKKHKVVMHANENCKNSNSGSLY